jgi:hypothetical protein
MRYYIVRGKMMQSKSTSIFKAGKLFTVMIVIGVGFVSAFLITSQIQDPIIKTTINSIPRTWHSLGDGTIAAGGSGFCYFMTYAHQAAPGTAYKTNLSNSSALSYEYRDALNGEMSHETPYSTAFDFVVKFRVNTTVGYNTSGSRWMDSWVRANITCNFQFATDIPALSAMTIVQIVNNSNYAWYHGYINNAHAGYQITKGETFNVTTLRVQGYY